MAGPRCGHMRWSRGCGTKERRISAIRDADQIVVLDAGRMVERGTHTELLARDGAYAALYEASAADAARRSAA